MVGEDEGEDVMGVHVAYWGPGTEETEGRRLRLTPGVEALAMMCPAGGHQKITWIVNMNHSMLTQTCTLLRLVNIF